MSKTSRGGPSFLGRLTIFTIFRGSRPFLVFLVAGVESNSGIFSGVGSKLSLYSHDATDSVDVNKMVQKIGLNLDF